MNISCDTCKKNNTQFEFDCPFITTKLTRFYDFIYYNDPDFGVYGCPVHYKILYNDFFKLYNYIEDGLINKLALSFNRRFIYNTFKEFLGLKTKHNRGKNE